MFMGTDGSKSGQLVLFGGANADSGSIQLYNGTLYDSTHEFWSITPDQSKFAIQETFSDRFTIDQNSGRIGFSLYGLGNISGGAEVYNLGVDASGNVVETDIAVKSSTTGEPTGSDVVVNMVSLTQAEYDAGTPVATTFYVITD